jgi:hypothetical protein
MVVDMTAERGTIRLRDDLDGEIPPAGSGDLLKNCV